VINNHYLSELKPLISDPAWKLIVARLEHIRSHADIRYHNANTENWQSLQGEYKMADRIYKLFENPKNLADDGIQSISPQGSVEGSRSTQTGGQYART
jgi:hypothetical protein